MTVKVVAVPKSATSSGGAASETAATALATMSAPSWDCRSTRMFSPVRTPGPTSSGRTPHSRSTAAQTVPVSGGTTEPTMPAVSSEAVWPCRARMLPNSTAYSSALRVRAASALPRSTGRPSGPNTPNLTLVLPTSTANSMAPPPFPRFLYYYITNPAGCQGGTANSAARPRKTRGLPGAVRTPGTARKGAPRGAVVRPAACPPVRFAVSRPASAPRARAGARSAQTDRPRQCRRQTAPVPRRDPATSRRRASSRGKSPACPS